MKNKLLSLLALLIVSGNFSTFTSTNDVYGQGRLYESDIKSVTLDDNDVDTVTFNLYRSTRELRGFFTLWVMFDSLEGADDSMTVEFVEMVTGESQGENSNGYTTVFSDKAHLVDSTWHAYTIQPKVTKTLRFKITHTGVADDSTLASLKLVYQ